jgi:DNA repair ATPase RecN
MEVIGAVSSVIALVETTSKLAKALAQLARKWQNAPEEIHALVDATKELAVKFAYVEDTITNSPRTLVDDVTRHGLLQLVTKANAANSDLETLQAKLEAYDSMFQRAKWAVKDAKTAKTVLAMIKDIEEALSMWISFVSLCVLRCLGDCVFLQH